MASASRPSEPHRLGLFPLPRVTLLPHQLLPLHVFEPRYLALIADALARDGKLGVPTLKPGYEADYYQSPEVYPVFGVGRIVEHRELTEGSMDILLRGEGCVRLLREERSSAYRIAEVEVLEDLPTASNLAPLRAEVFALGTRILEQLPEQVQVLTHGAQLRAGEMDAPEYIMASLLPRAEQRLLLLEERDRAQRLALLLELLHGVARKLKLAHPEQLLH